MGRPELAAGTPGDLGSTAPEIPNTPMILSLKPWLHVK